MGIGGEWGTREELLHPRDRRGRFRKKWKMPEAVINAITGFLDRFSPRTFQSDGQAAQYLFNRAKPGRFGGGTQYSRLHADFDEANEHLRTGDIDEPTAKYVKMMDDAAVDLDSDIIVSKTVGPEAFGLTAEGMGAEDGGIEDFTGRLLGDRGYQAANIGTPMGHGPGKVTMTIAVPKGTKAVIPARSQNDRGVFLDRDQELRVTKVKSDGRGGWYMMAVATPRTPGDTPEPIDRSPRGVGLTPEQREERVLGIQRMQAKREGIQSDVQLQQEAIARGNRQVLQEQPAQLPAPQQQQTPAVPAPAPQQPAAPGAPAPRNEPILTESVGGTDVSGRSTAEIAQTPAPEPVEALAAPPPPPDFRQAVRDAGIPVPSAGPRRREWNNAYTKILAGKDPGDMLRELDADIASNQRRLRVGDPDPDLPRDIRIQEQLADLISSTYNVPRRPGEQPAPSPTAPKATPGAPSTTAEAPVKAAKAAAPRKRAPAKKAATPSLTPDQQRQVSDLSDQERRSYQGFRSRGRSHEEALQSAQDSVAARNARQAEQANVALAKKAAPAPAKRVAPVKKAAPAPVAPGAEPDLDKMTKADLLAEAERQNVVVRKSWTKDQIKSAIRTDESVGRQLEVLQRGTTPEERESPVRPAPVKKAAAPAATEPTNEDLIKRLFNNKRPTVAQLRQFAEDRRVGEGMDLKRMSRRELVETIIGEATPRRGLGSIPPAPTPRAVPTPGPTPSAPAPITTAPVRLRPRDIKVGDTIAATRGLPGRRDDPNVPSGVVARIERDPGAGNREFRFLNEAGDVIGSASPNSYVWRRAEGASAPSVEPAAPAAQALIQTPDRREPFAEDWLNTPALANIGEKTAAGRSINEIRDDILKGKITPDEGIRRLENDIEINKEDLAEVERELRGDLSPQERSRLLGDREKLRQAISDEENASSFMRKHFRKAPAITPQEVEVQLDPEAAQLIEKATPDQIREAARVGGFKELKGETKDELLQDLIKNIAGEELERRAAKRRVAAKKLTPTPVVTKKSSDPDYVDARALAEGLDMTDDDQDMLKRVQRLLDGDEKPPGSSRIATPAAVGRELEGWAGHGPDYGGTVARVAGNEDDASRLEAQANRWRALAERLKKTRRRPARKATEPAPEKPKLSTAEKATTREAAKLLDVEPEALQKQVLAKKAKAAPPAEGAKSAVEAMRTMQSREEGQQFLARRTKLELQEIAKAGGVDYGSKDTKQKIADQIVQWTIGRRLDTEALTKPSPPRAPEAPRPIATGGGPLQRVRPSYNSESGPPLDRPNADEPLNVPRLTMSGSGLMHGDSTMGKLWNDLYRDDRTPNSTLNRIMQLGLAMANGDRDFTDIMRDLRQMQADAPDSAVQARIGRAVDDIDAPEVSVPDLPDTVPSEVREALSQLAKIPTARRTGRVGITSVDQSIFDKKLDIVRRIDRGELSSFDVQTQLGRRDLHESVDGAVQMWDIFDRLSNNDAVKRWAREARRRQSEPPATPAKATKSTGNVTQLPERTEPRKTTAAPAPSTGATVTRLPVAKGGKLPPGLQEVVTKLRAATSEADARAALSGLLGVELKRILASLGLSDAGSKADWIQRLVDFATR